MNLPNAITASRFLMAGAGALALLFFPSETGFLFAFGIFIIAAISDWLDGVLARKMGRMSPLGAFMDPLADKVIIYMYFVYLTYAGLYPVWLLMAFLARDLMHDGYRAYAASTRVSMPANFLSKVKTALQMFSIIGAMLAVILVSMPLAQASFIAMAVALVSGIAGSVQTVSKHKSYFSSGE